MKKVKTDELKTLTSTTKTRVRFGEIDAMLIVWHGNYIKYLEDGRETFGYEYGLNYQYICEQGYILPVVDLKVQYIKSASLDDVIRIETTYIASPSAKMIFSYKIYRDSDSTLLTQAQTTQLFQTNDRKLVIDKPPFIEEWEKRHKIFIPKE